MKIINQTQRDILHSFGSIPDSSQFYLTGGTALSYFYLQHRMSYDLDFFTTTGELILPFSRQLETHLTAIGMTITRHRSFSSFVELEATLKNERTLVHLGLDTAFRFSPTREFPEFPGLRVDGLEDLASNKLLALFGRATLRDFVDVYCLETMTGLASSFLMEKAKLKDPGFDAYWLGVALERIETFRKEEVEQLMVRSIDFDLLRAHFVAWRKKISSDLNRRD